MVMAVRAKLGAREAFIFYYQYFPLFFYVVVQEIHKGSP
ncbi:hypothetical protein RintRC_1832 [Richelia intracellularis]|nr:hypothetical protein RintRC_1832 [Richelia intracellularis]